MLHVQNVTKKYGEFDAVKGISFSVTTGEIVGIIGPNGAGKSTTLKMICGLLEPTSGSIRLDGLDGKGARSRSHLGYVPEDSPVYDDMSVLDYLRFFGSLYDMSSQESVKKGTEILTSLDFHRMNEALGNLSKGMKRKVMIARSLLHDPKLLIYDEPASGLDPVTSRYIVNYIKKLKTKEKAIVLSGHNLFQLEQLCDRIILIKDGEVHFDGPIAEIKGKVLQKKITITYNLKGKQHSLTVDEKNLNNQLKVLMGKSAQINHISSAEGSLEDVFLALTS